jgi:hypothetical protein
MEEVLASGKTKSIGVSNFGKKDLEAILETCKVRPAINQIEFHPYLQHEDLLQFHKNKDIRVSAYGPLTPITKVKGGPLDPMLESLAKKYAVNPGEILLRWCVDQNVLPITTSSKEQRLSDMLRIFTFQLTPKEVEEISEKGNSHHFRGFWQDKFDKDDRSWLVRGSMWQRCSLIILDIPILKQAAHRETYAGKQGRQGTAALLKQEQPNNQRPEGTILHFSWRQLKCPHPSFSFLFL